MKRLLAVLLATIALPVFGQGWTVMGHSIRQTKGPQQTGGVGSTNEMTFDDPELGQWVNPAYGSNWVTFHWTCATNFPLEWTSFDYRLLQSDDGSTFGRTVTTSFTTNALVNDITHIEPKPYYLGTTITNNFVANIGVTPQYYTVLMRAYTNYNLDATPQGTFQYNTNCFGCQTAVPGKAEWVKQQRSYLATPFSVGVDSTNNVVIAGTFGNSISFEGGPFVVGNGGYIAKYSSTGTYLWSNCLFVTIWSAALDSQGNIIIGGGFTGTRDFGGTTLTSNDPQSQDAFVAKYSPNGNLQWVHQGFTLGYAAPIGIDSSDGIVAGLNLSSGATFGSVNITSSGSVSLAIVKFGSAGTAQWGKSFTNSLGNNKLRGISASGTNIIISGQLAGPANLGSGALESGNAFISCYSSNNGAYQWSRMLTNISGVNGVAVEAGTGKFFVTGTATAKIIYLGGAPVTNAWGTGGFFIAAYGATNNYLWAKAYGALGDVGNAIAVDGSGNLSMTGTSGGPTDFLENYIPTYGQGYIIATFTTAGVYRWNSRANGASSGVSVVYDSSGHVNMHGQVSGPMSIGGIPISNYGYDGFVVQFDK